jgi:uncharacterized protein YdeI (YjbR/CyaY-like superfamily)
MQTSPLVDLFFIDGCGRCKLYKTPTCKVHTWSNELQILRHIALNSGLIEELKWKQPCYTLNGKNIIIISAFKDSCVINFMKGALLSDPYQLLEMPGENSQSARFIRFTSSDKIITNEIEIKRLIQEAIEVEKSGAKIESKKVTDYIYPEELSQAFENDKKFEDAFNKLTPGRQKAYLIHYNSAKQSNTRTSRIKKSKEAIFAGKGWNERY